MDGDFIVLRVERAPVLGDPFAGGAFNFAGPAVAAAPPELAVDVASLNKAELADVQRDPQVVGVAPSMPAALIEPVETADVAAPNAPGSTWGVQATGAINSSLTGKGVTVAVLDTGIDAGHVAFAGLQPIEKDFTGSGNGDRQGHGTHVAGTIFGRDVNGFRFGVAPGVDRALIGKVLDDAGSGETAWIFSGILWALENGANIISMSLGMDFPGMVNRLIGQGMDPRVATSLALQAYRANVRLFDTLASVISARSAMSSKGTLVIAASGNESNRPAFEIAVAPPAVAIGIMSVGALGQTGVGLTDLEVARFSNTGANVVAPGVKVLSAKAGGGFSEKNGTSMATPHVAGVAALWAQQLLNSTGRIDPQLLVGFLMGRATTAALKSGFDSLDVGAGLVQAPA